MIAFLFAAAAALGNLAGGWAIIGPWKKSHGVIDLFLAFSAGFMLSVALLEVAPEAISQRPDAPVFMLAGYLAVHLAQHVLVPHFHFGEETHRISPRQGVAALAGLLLHTFFDGVAIASGFLVSPHLGLLLFLAVFLHKIPEGLTVSSLMLAGGQSRSRALGAAGLLGVATMAGVFATEFAQPIASHGLAISAGVTIYVAASNLVPELQARHKKGMSFAFFGGAAAFFLTRALVSAAGLGAP